MEAFRKFLENTKSVDIIEVLSEEDCWEKLEDKDDYPDAINVLTRYDLFILTFKAVRFFITSHKFLENIL